MRREAFGETPEGGAVELITLTAATGAELQVLTRGAAIRSLRVPDRRGTLDDVVLGYDSLAGYLADAGFQGAVVGRFANRIAGGSFELDGRRCRLPLNDGPNHLHGGPRGFYTVLWRAREVELDAAAVTLSYTSPDGEEGYPGTLEASVRYTLTDRNELIVDYRATTDRATPVNLTQHAYFNLAGADSGDVLAHELTLFADHFLPTDENGIPLAAQAPVRGTPFDFTLPRAIGERIDADHSQLRIGRGYDHHFVLRGEPGDLRPAARVREPSTGRVMEVLTTEPGVQLYTGNHLDGAVGKGGHRLRPRSGLCLETQHFPDSPNRPDFPSTILRPGEEFTSRTVYRFGVES